MKKSLIFNLVKNKQTNNKVPQNKAHAQKEKELDPGVGGEGDRNECVTETGEATYLKFFVFGAQRI